MEQSEDNQPKDLSMRANKRLKPIPPPLNLAENASALKEFAIIATSPKSPLMQKNLPFRKRAHSLSGTNDVRTIPFTTVKSPLSVNTTDSQKIHEVEKSVSIFYNETKDSRTAPIVPFPTVKSPLSVDTTESQEVHEVEKSVNIFYNVSQSTPSEVVKTISYCNSRGQVYPPISEKEVCVVSESSITEKEVCVVSESSNLIQQQNSTTYSLSWSPTLGQMNTPTTSSVLMSPVGSSREELSSAQNVHPWPAAVWHCFQPGTYVKLDYPSSGNNNLGMYRLVEEHGPSDWIGALRVEQIEEDHSALQVCIQFCCLGTGVFVTARCHSLHTFFVKEKGWCAVHPDQVAVCYQVPCQPLELGDICYPPQSLSPDVCDRFKRFSFPPEEITVLTPFILSPPSSPCKKPSDSDRPKRPMNAFMLFAKRYRLELIQTHPGKDNRAISVLLGEEWRKLPPADKEEFVLEARAMAQEQKRLHPDCWKRKRSHSTS